MKTNTEMTTRDFAILRMQRRHLAVVCLPKLVSARAQGALTATIEVIDEILGGQPPKADKVPANRNRAAVQAHLTRLNRKLTGTRGKIRVALKDKIAAFEQRLVEIDTPTPPKAARKPRARRTVEAPVTPAEQVELEIAA